MQRRPIHVLIATTMSIAFMGCGNQPSVSTDSKNLSRNTGDVAKEPAATALKVPRMRVSNRPANLKGSVFIVEYHHIRDGKTTMDRSLADFRSDLERLYKLGFRPVGMAEYLSGNMDLAPGASPVVFTFDDANPTQFQILPDGSVDPKCGVGIWQTFAKEHTDFPIKATFFVLPQMWGQPNLVEKKVAMLKEWGCELGNHTVTHPNLKKLQDAEVQRELAGGADLLAKWGWDGPNLFAMPMGISPKNRDLLTGFTLNGKKVEIQAAFLVGANPAPTSTSANFDKTRIPRIQACKGTFGLEDWLNQVEKGSVKPFVAP